MHLKQIVAPWSHRGIALLLSQFFSDTAMSLTHWAELKQALTGIKFQRPRRFYFLQPIPPMGVRSVTRRLLLIWKSECEMTGDFGGMLWLSLRETGVILGRALLYGMLFDVVFRFLDDLLCELFPKWKN